MATARVTVAEKAPTPESLQALGPLNIDVASHNTSMGGMNKVEGNDIDSEDDIDASAEDVNVSERRKAQIVKFAAWMSKRAARVTKKEVQAMVENADGETLSIRALMARQDSTRIIADPREYQLELFERAKTENVIAVLDTGSGKTLIAVLLLKHILDIELEDRFRGKEPRISFFLVNSVTLVYQQAAVLDKNLDQKIDCLCGEMRVDLWSAEIWKRIFAENMVIVCTAEILHQCLMHSYIKIHQINLMIFDEAHHAKKNHAYARIIKDYYVSQDPSERPKIFGMTASPVDSKEDVVKTAKELEVMLHSRIVTAPNLSLLRYAISHPEEVILPYERPLGTYGTPLCLKLKAEFGEVKVFAKHFASAREHASALGDWCADQIWAMALVDEEHGNLERKTQRYFQKIRKDHAVALLDADLGKLKGARDFIARWNFVPPALDGSSISNKAKVLLAYLDQALSTQAVGKCIIFVSQRWTARLLRELIARMCAIHVRPELLIGTKAGPAGDQSISFKKQMETLDNFRKGKINCLIATSVAEEGLDISDCNLVIRYDLYTTLIQYIQSRGRARHANSTFVHMIESGNKAHLQLIQETRRGEEKLRHFCESLPADRLLQGDDQEINFDGAVVKERGQRKYVDPSTTATLTYASSMVVLDHFVQSLPSNGESLPRAAYHVFREEPNFVCEVILPPNSPIHSATGGRHSSKLLAKRSAAFEACMLLRQKEYLNGCLISTYRKLLPQMRNARLALTANKSHSYTRKLKPKLWEISRGSLPSLLYITILELERPESLGMSSQPLAIMTRTPLPNFPAFILNLQIDKCSSLLCTSGKQGVEVNGSMLDLLDFFTLKVFEDVFNKEFEANKAGMSYWLAPVVDTWRSKIGRDIIDWSTLRNVLVNAEGLKWSIDAPAKHYVNRFLIDRWDGGRRFYALAVEPDLRPRDAVPEGAAKHRYMNSILDYSVSLFSASRGKAIWNESQPVFKAYQLPQRINWLDDFTEQQDKVKTTAWLCLEPLLISALPVPVVAMARMLPGIIYRLESYLIAMEAFEHIDLSVRPELALEAFTKNSDNTEEHHAQQIHVQRSMGKNYERLEFIGDCFLKMATSISLFVRNPGDSEFEYHVSRMVMICNKNLLKTALDEELYAFIRSGGFSRREWYPEGLKLMRGKGVGKSGVGKAEHKLAEKTIADVCEAVIGAALLSQKDSGDMDLAVKAVTILVRNEDHNVSSWAEYYPLYKKPAYQTANPSASHLDLAAQVELKHPYHFKSPRLLRSAFIHPSQPFAVEKIPCYQRLEFLGDALLDMASDNFLFHGHPDRDPQWLTEHKMAMVSNKFLAALSVKLGFHKHLRYIGAAIEKQNRDYVVELEEAEAAADGARDYWTNAKQPPKALSDIVESFVGALFVDSEFNYKEVERFFDAHMRWFFEDITVYDTFANNHPTTYLHKLLTLTFGCSEYRLMASEVESVIPGGQATSVAALMVHDEIVADGEANSGKQAKVRASSSALKLLQGISREEYRLAYRCDCVENEEKVWKGKDGNGIGMVGTAI